MIRHAMILLACLAFGTHAPKAYAKAEVENDIRLIRAREPVNIRPDKAYVLLRFDTTLTSFTANLLRIPTDAEMDAYDSAKKAAHAKAGPKAPPLTSFAFDYGGPPNFYALPSSKWLVQSEKVKTVLAELPPGDYVLYGHGFAAFLGQCLCLGTVGFELPAGRITDLGTMLLDRADKLSTIPELASETNLGPSARTDYVLLAAGLRPARAGVDIPSSLASAAIILPQLHAVGPFVEPNTLLINRLAPIPGILAYEAGYVIDVPSGSRLPND